MDQPPSSPARPVLGVGIVIFNDKDEIVLIRRGKPPRLDEWSIPGGHLEWGESLVDAALREAREETGLTVEILGLIDAVDSLSRDENGAVIRHFVLIDFAARAVSGTLAAGSDARDARFVPCSMLDEYDLWSETARVIRAAARFK